MKQFYSWIFIPFAGLLLMAMASCGFKEDLKKERTPAPEFKELSLFREGACEEEPLESLSPKHPFKKAETLNSKVQELVSKAASFTLRYNQQHFPHVMAPQDIDVNNAFAPDPLNPLILSQEKLSSELERLLKKWRRVVGEENLQIMASTQEVKPLRKFEELNEISSIHRDLHILKRKAERFHALSCSYPTLQARSENDVRAYFIAKEKVEAGFSIEDPSMEAFLLAMCGEFNTQALCSLEYLMSKRQGRLVPFFQNSVSHFEKRLGQFFEPHQATKWECHKEEEQTIVKVKLQKDLRLKRRLFGTYEVLKSFVKEKWSNEKVRVELEMVNPGTENSLKVIWTPSALSFVSRNKPYLMNLSSKLNFSQLTLTFAHELGHVFGFPDCYHEFYDQRAKEIVYYTLDKSGENLMCHLNGKATIQDSYLEQLPENVCL